MDMSMKFLYTRLVALAVLANVVGSASGQTGRDTVDMGRLQDSVIAAVTQVRIPVQSDAVSFA